MQKSELLNGIRDGEKKFSLNTRGLSAYVYGKEFIEVKNLYYHKMYNFVDFYCKNGTKVEAGTVFGRQHVEIDQGVGFYGGFDRYLYAPCTGTISLIDKDGIVATFKPDNLNSKDIKIKSPHFFSVVTEWLVKEGDIIDENQVIGALKIKRKEEYIISPFSGKVRWLSYTNPIPNTGTLLEIEIENKFQNQ